MPQENENIHLIGYYVSFKFIIRNVSIRGYIHIKLVTRFKFFFKVNYLNFYYDEPLYLVLKQIFKSKLSLVLINA